MPKRIEMPGFIKPQLATLKSKAPKGDQWLHEIKYRTISSKIRKQLETVISPKSKLSKPLKKPQAIWVEPVFKAEIEYRDITSEGLLRASSFKGLKGTGRS